MPKPIDTHEIRARLDHAGIQRADVLSLCDEIDRLRGEQQTPPQFQGKTVEVCIPCVVGEKSGWMGGGTSPGLLSFLKDQTPESQAASMLAGFERDTGQKGAIRWLTATLPVPAEVAVVARVEGE